MLTRENFTGPWAGLPVAWTEQDEFDEATYRGDVVRCCEAGVPGVYTGGTSGEFYAQEWEEFQRIAQATVEECHRYGIPAMIGCTSTSTHGAARRARFAAEIGADAVQVALPFWMEVPDDQILPFFLDVANAAEGLALSIYETRRAKKTLTVEQHQQIHDANPRYLMVKANEATVGDSLDGCRELSKIVNVFVGEDRWVELGPCGAAGACSSLIYWNPQVLLKTWGLVRDHNWPALEADGRKMSALFGGLFATFGDRGFTDSAYDRLAGIATGFLKSSLKNRLPYPAPMASDIDEMRRVFEKHYPEMLYEVRTAAD